MLTREDRDYIVKEHLRNILHISDKNYQKRVWIQGKGPECDDFTETVCHFFDDGDSILADYKRYGVSENQYKILKTFSDKFEEFSDEEDYAEEFIDSPEWDEITKMAKDVLKAFNFPFPSS